MATYRFYLILIVVLAGGLPSNGQYISDDLSEQARLSVITVGPAQPLYTAFGHTAIRLKDAKRGIDVIYNYGTFDFQSDSFYWKFARGDLSYFLSKDSFETFKKENKKLGRSIQEQVLDLGPAEARQIVSHLETELLPQNRCYQYKFFANNCVTKVRDLLAEQGVWDLSQFKSSTVTYRQLLKPYLRSKPWTAFAINLLLGAPADQPIGAWEQQFLPNQLHQSLDSAHILATHSPLVREKNKIARSSFTFNSPNWITPVVLFWLFFAGVAGFTWYNLMNRNNCLWLDRILFGSIGFVGIVLLFLWIGSHHHPLHNNWNLLWALPTHLVIAGGSHQLLRSEWLQYYMWVSILGGGLLLIGWNVIPQQFPAAVLPIVLAIQTRLVVMLFNKRIKMIIQRAKDHISITYPLNSNSQ